MSMGSALTLQNKCDVISEQFELENDDFRHVHFHDLFTVQWKEFRFIELCRNYLENYLKFKLSNYISHKRHL